MQRLMPGAASTAFAALIAASGLSGADGERWRRSLPLARLMPADKARRSCWARAKRAAALQDRMPTGAELRLIAMAAAKRERRAERRCAALANGGWTNASRVLA